MQTELARDAFCHASQDVARALGTDAARGLSARDAAARLKAFGPNTLRRVRPQSALTILRHQFQSVIVLLLAAAAAVSLAFGDVPDAVAILVVLLLNGAIGFVTELRAARSMEALRHLADVRTRVRRDGAERMIEAQHLVPGDLVVLEPGDIVTADLRLTEAANLTVDESVLTGESVPVAKSTAAVTPGAGLSDRLCMAYKGAAITEGSGEGLVTGTGMATEIGRISDMVQTAQPVAALLDRRLDDLGHRLVWLTLVLAVLTIGAGLFRGFDPGLMVQTGIALAVAAVPEGLPVVATLCLARGMWRMSARNAVITRLSSVETLGAVTVILTDKTGTLTENRMTAVRYLLAGGDVALPQAAAPPGDADALGWALRIGALCNNAGLGRRAQDDHPGDPMEVALLQAAAQGGMDPEALRDAFPERREHAFDPDHKMMATVHDRDGQALFAVKGAPESVLALCTSELGPHGPVAMTAARRADWSRRNEGAAAEGLRLLALAMKQGPDPQADPYAGLTLVGLVCLRDPLRPDVPGAIAASRAAGVRVVMLTGDHAGTARSIAQAAGLADGAARVIEGEDLAGLDPATVAPGLKERILAADVFARVAPETKLALVTLFQGAGHVVAMTGDGVNDAPALKKADIGIAMGRRGTQVAQEAAAMVLRDDAFGTIIAAMHQGRVIFGNIRKFVVYLMSCNVSEVLVVGLAMAGGLPMPLLPLQILFLNLVTDVFPAFALGLGQGDGAVMRRPPRDPADPIVDRRRWGLIAALGGAITLATLGGFALALFWLELDTARAVTVAFLTLALGQLWNVFNMRGAGTGLLRNDVTANRFVWAAILLCLALIGLALWLPPLSRVLALPDPGAAGLALAAAASLCPLVLGQAFLRLAHGPSRIAEQGRQGLR